MSQAKDGDTVSIHYSGTLDDGTLFDSSAGRDPLEFTLGTGSVISGFESAVTGMAVGQKKSTTIPATEAYGPHDPDMVQEVPRAQIPDEVELEIGGRLQAQGPDGQVFVLTVTSFSDDTVTLDGNHPLAGKDLTFEIELVGIA